MELQLVQQLVPLPDEQIRQKVVNNFNASDYERNYKLLKLWFEEEVQGVCDENYQNQIHVILRGAKNDYSRAKKRLKNFFLNKEPGKFPEWYQFYDLTGKFHQYKHFYCLCQPGITPEGHRISCLGFSSPEIEHFDVDILFKALFMTDHLGACLGHPYFIGIITIIDCKYATTKHALKILSWTFRKYAKFQSEIMPYRLVKLYMINVPKYIERFVTIGKAFVSEKLRSRFCIEQSDTEMRQQIPKELLPSDYGGLGESISSQCERWFELLHVLRPWYEAERAVRLRPQNASTTSTTSATGATTCNAIDKPLVKTDYHQERVPHYDLHDNQHENGEEHLLIEKNVKKTFNCKKSGLKSNKTKKNDKEVNDDDKNDCTMLKFRFGQLEID